MKKLTLRLSDALHVALKELSEQEDRSLHGEIIYRLKRAIESKKSHPQDRKGHSQEKELYDAE